MPVKVSSTRIDTFALYPGRKLAGRYEVIQRLGAGWEGEVYLVRELATNIERAAKFFFPQHNPRDKAAQFFARKLHKLRHCPIVIQYFAQDSITHEGERVPFLISEFVQGELLSEFLQRQPGKRMSPFQAVHLLHALAKGMECIHQLGEYHGDLHTDNIIIQRFGLGFDLKLLDIYQWKAPRGANIREDVINMIHIFYGALGGQTHYARQPPVVKSICCGLKRNLIFKKFKRAGKLRTFLENLDWE
ncbi:MAG: protein kinase [Acidiferrobacterales bacterium]